MRELPRSLRFYLAFVVGLSVLAWAGSLYVPFETRSGSLLLAIVLAGAVAVVQHVPRHILTGTKMSLYTVPLVAAVILLPVWAATAAVVIGFVVAELWQRHPGCEVVFNGAAITLQVAIGGMLYAALAGGLVVLPGVVAAMVAAVVMFLLGITLVAGSVSTHHALPYSQIWRQIAWETVLTDATMFLIGAILAALVSWNLALGLSFFVGVMLLYLWVWRMTEYPVQLFFTLPEDREGYP